MKKLIHKYLTECYYIKYDCVYLKRTKRSDYFELIYNLNLVFGLSLKQSKWYLKSWFFKYKFGKYFNTFWSRILFFCAGPRYQGLTASELISVQPLSPPNGLRLFGYIK